VTDIGALAVKQANARQGAPAASIFDLKAWAASVRSLADVTRVFAIYRPGQGATPRAAASFLRAR